MSVIRKPVRVKVDGDVTVGDYQGILKKFMVALDTRDLVRVFKGWGTATWNTAPEMEHLNLTHALVSLIVDVVPNCVISHVRICKAIKAEHLSAPCIFADKPLDYAIGDMSKSIRIALSKWRTISGQRFDASSIWTTALGLAQHYIFVCKHFA